MNAIYLRKVATVMIGAGLALSASVVLAQDFPNTATAQPMAANVVAPQMPYGVSQILQLSQAKVGDDTINAYIKNSGNSYGLNSDQIIYLKQQGVSDAVITTMLNQPKPGASAPYTYTPTTPAPQPVASTASAQPNTMATVAPAVTYVQTVPTTTYYYQPYYYPYYNYPYYTWCPPVSLSFAWGWNGGYYGGWRGGYYGGGHGGGGWHR